MTRTVTVRTWQRWLVLSHARYSQSAYQAVKHYKSLSDAPPEVRDAMAWAIERNHEQQ